MPLRILSRKGAVQIKPFWKLGGKCHFLLQFSTHKRSETYENGFSTTSFCRPQTKFAKVMFSQVSVCPWGRGVCLPRGVVVVVVADTHHPRQTPRADTTCPPGRHHLPPGQTPPGQTVNKRAVRIPLEFTLVIN